MKFEYPAGATPLDPDEIVGLILGHITTHFHGGKAIFMKTLLLEKNT